MTSPPRLVFIDFEASSLHPTSYPVEVGVAEPRRDDTGWIITVQGWLIRPADEWLARPDGWSAASERIHGLDRDTLLREGVPIPDIAAALDEALHGRITVSSTGRHSWDEAWLAVLADASGAPPWPPRWKVAKEPSGDLHRGLARRAGLSDDDLMRLLATAPPHAHTAGGDAYRDAYVWASLKEPDGEPPRLDPTSSYRRRDP